MIISKTIEIDMGHRVPNHKSKCKNFHGHRYKIEVGVDGKVIKKKGSSSEGMVIDYGDLKEILINKIHNVFDHGFVMYEYDEYHNIFTKFKKEGQNIYFVPFIPTAENLADYWASLIVEPLRKKGIKLKFVKVWETPTSLAIYSE